MASDKIIERIYLPFPPSVNGLYAGKSHRYKSKAYRNWLDVCPELEALEIDYPIKILYTFWWPDNRKRDGQNYLKAPLDYLVSQGVFADDCWQVISSEAWQHKGVHKGESKMECLILRVDD